MLKIAAIWVVHMMDGWVWWELYMDSTRRLFALFSHTGLLVLQRYGGVLLIIIGCHHNWATPQTDTSTHAYTRHTLRAELMCLLETLHMH